MNIFYTAYLQSDFFGKCIFLALFALSVLCWVVLIHKIWIIRNIQKISTLFQAALQKNQEALLSLDLQSLPKPGKAIPHPFGEVFSVLKDKTLEILNKNHFFVSKEKKADDVFLSSADLELIESSAVTAISIEAKKIEKNLFILSMIVTLAPFLGLLGTVWGILITFAGLQSGASVHSNSAVLGGLSTALATTVLGLVIAVPALISHSYLKNMAHTLASQMEDFCYQMLSSIELQYRKIEM